MDDEHCFFCGTETGPFVRLNLADHDGLLLDSKDICYPCCLKEQKAGGRLAALDLNAGTFGDNVPGLTDKEG